MNQLHNDLLTLVEKRREGEGCKGLDPAGAVVTDGSVIGVNYDGIILDEWSMGRLDCC